MRRHFKKEAILILFTLFSGVQASATSNAPSACSSNYVSFFREPVTDITLAIGYFDTTDEGENTVLSSEEENDFVSHITAFCGFSGRQLCGFTHDNGGTYSKRIQFGPNRSTIVRIHVLNAALSADNSYNRAHAAEQQALTTSVENQFLQAIQSGQSAVFYYGHSRNGGGPSFEPPRLTPDGKVDYPWYIKTHPGKTAVVEALDAAAKAGHAPDFFGSFSCNSLQEFSKSYEAASPNTAFILSTWISVSDQDMNALETSIELMLNSKCFSDFDQTLEKTSDEEIDYQGKQQESKFEVVNFNRAK